MIEDRPHFKGLPVPFIVGWDGGESVPDFKELDAVRWMECVSKRLCALCGDPVGGLCAWIGGPACRDSRCFTDPAMHEHCARVAAELCPFVAGRKDYAPSTKAGERPTPYFNTKDRPLRMYLMLSRDYSITTVDGSPVVKSSTFLSTELIHPHH